MRYNRMTEVLKTVASVKLSSAFLLKSYFLKKPLARLYSDQYSDPIHAHSDIDLDYISV